MLEVIEKIPIKDATINSAMPYENYGDYYAVFAGQYMNHSIYRGLLQFDLPTLSGKGIVEKTQLLLYIVRNDDTALEKKFEVYRIVENFDESKVNFENKPGFDKELYQMFTIKDEINTFIKIDITKLFSEWYCEKYANYGLLIKAVDETQNALVGFHSKDTQGCIYAPKVQIHFNRYKEIEKIKVNNVRNCITDKLSSEKYYKLGNDYYEDGDYDAAFNCYQKSLENYIPNELYVPKLFYMTIKVLEKLEKYEKALEIIEQGLKIYPNFTDLVFLKARQLHKQEKTHLAIKSLYQCMDMGESPLQINVIAGVESYRTLHTLAQIYYELGDLEQAYSCCVKSLHNNAKYTEPLHIILKILIEKKRDLKDIKSKLESFLGIDLDGKDYMILGNIFLKQSKYTTACEYFSKAEEFMNKHSKISYGKGVCLLYLREYKKAYEHFNLVREGELYEDALYKGALCEILSYNMDNAAKILSILRNPENDHKRRIYYALRDILENKTIMAISDEREGSERFVHVIFDLLDTLIQAAVPETFERGLQLLNLIEHDEVLLRLGKLYYKHRLYHMAYQEFMRSIKLFEKIDSEGLSMMKKALDKMMNLPDSLSRW